MSEKHHEHPPQPESNAGLGRAFVEAAELLAEQPRRMAKEFRELGRKYEKISRKIAHGSRRTNGRIG